MPAFSLQLDLAEDQGVNRHFLENDHYMVSYIFFL